MEPYLGDLEKTEILTELFERSGDLRDVSWREKFLENVADASFACGDPQVIVGPDGFTYFHLTIPEPYKAFQCYVIRHMTVDFLLKEGFGVVINPSKEQPDWVFSYGDIVNFHLTNTFYSQAESDLTGSTEKLKEGEEILTGQPAESYLPMQVRTVLRRYLESMGISGSKIMLLTRIINGQANHELAFNLTQAHFPDETEYTRVMGTLQWFLPRHYNYSSMDEKKMKNMFSPL